MQKLHLYLTRDLPLPLIFLSQGTSQQAELLTPHPRWYKGKVLDPKMWPLQA